MHPSAKWAQPIGVAGETDQVHKIKMTPLTTMSVLDLLALHVEIMDQLRNRCVIRSENNPTGDLAEYLFCRAFGWVQNPNSSKGVDAAASDGTRYQIKGRRLHKRNLSRQLSAIRDIDGFDFLAAVLFDHKYRVSRAALIPASIVHSRATFVEYTSSHKFMLPDQVWDLPGVIDVTAQLRTAEEQPSPAAGYAR